MKTEGEVVPVVDMMESWLLAHLALHPSESEQQSVKESEIPIGGDSDIPD